MSYHIDTNLEFTSDIKTDNSLFDCSSLVSLDYRGNDTAFGNALNNEFSSLKCSVLAYDALDESVK